MNMMKQAKVYRFAILGAGGIGCYYGARLLMAGNKVSFVARGEHLAALKHDGLDLQHSDFSFKGAVDACSLEELLEHEPADFDALLVCVKATATQELASNIRQWFEHTGQETAIISLQNGVDNEPKLAEILGGDVVIGGLAVRIGGHIIRPGVVESTGIAQIVLGAWPGVGSPADRRFGSDLTYWVEAFNRAGIPTRQVSDIRHEIWRKLVINNGVNPLSALTRLDTRSLSHHPLLGNIVHQLMQEAARAAAADGELLTDQDAQEMFDLIRDFDPIKTSMLVDLEKGRQLEVDAISGAVLQRSRKLGITAPHTERVHTLLKTQLGEVRR
ncbi:MAG: ketopantoate reductase family protein [Sedimenticola sp.]